MTTFAGKPVTKPQVAGTLKMLRYYRAFLASDCTRCRDPGKSGRDGWMGNELDKAGAQERLWFLVNTAINRKAGIADTEWNIEEWKDRLVAQYLVRRTGQGHQWQYDRKKFHLRGVQKRFGHLIKERDWD